MSWFDRMKSTILKVGNPYHDEKGRFTHGDGASGVTARSEKDRSTEEWINAGKYRTGSAKYNEHMAKAKEHADRAKNKADAKAKEYQQESEGASTPEAHKRSAQYHEYAANTYRNAGDKEASARHSEAASAHHAARHAFENKDMPDSEVRRLSAAARVSSKRTHRVHG